MFDEKLYPDAFAGKFTVEARERSIDPPSYLSTTNAEEYKRESDELHGREPTQQRRQ